jgi:hypothetical protein
MSAKPKLKIVSVNKREYTFFAEMHHRSIAEQDRGRQMIRRYMSIDSALDRADRWLRHYGRVGSVVVIHNKDGFELGTIRMSAKGTITKKWWLE